jgi:hypothetical protein
MIWARVVRAVRHQPAHGSWRDWLEQISRDCGGRCVYCAIPESRYGGIENFHVDHFRPKSVPRFRRLSKSIGNLYLSCAICNRFKGDDWPNDPAADHSVPAYPDPSDCDYNTLFAWDKTTHQLDGKFTASRYVVERLYLNRPQLIRERWLHCLDSSLSLLRNAFEGSMPTGGGWTKRRASCTLVKDHGRADRHAGTLLRRRVRAAVSNL